MPNKTSGAKSYKQAFPKSSRVKIPFLESYPRCGPYKIDVLFDTQQ